MLLILCTVRNWNYELLYASFDYSILINILYVIDRALESYRIQHRWSRFVSVKVFRPEIDMPWSVQGCWPLVWTSFCIAYAIQIFICARSSYEKLKSKKITFGTIIITNRPVFCLFTGLVYSLVFVIEIIQ